jgi:apolipoprotein N-acyltransferase
MPRAVATGILLGLSFPPFNYSFLIWFALIPLVLSPAESFWHRFRNGVVAGTVGNLFIFFWMWKTFNTAGVSVFTTGPVWFLLSVVLSLYVGLFNAWISWIRYESIRPWMGAALWLALDLVKSTILTGFPWALLSHTQASQTSLIQITSFTGAEGITFLIVLVNLQLSRSLSFLLNQPKTGRVLLIGARQLALILVIPVLCLMWGRSRIKALQDLPSSREVRVAILQGNIDQYQKWDQAYEAQIRNVYGDLAKTAALGDPDILVWPETAVPGWYPNEKMYVDWIREISTTTKVYQLIGAVSSRNGRDTNSAFLVDTKGEMKSHYDKTHLVPFGEYLPLGGPLRKIIPYLGKLGTFSAGKQPSIFTWEDVRFAPNICYEAVFPELVRKSVRAGGDIIVNITNDGWYLDTGAPMQHYVTNIFRAIENGRPVIRAANTGISAVIDPLGRELFRSSLNERGIFFSSIRIPDEPIETAFNKFGNWFGVLCSIVSLLVYFALCLENLKSR